MKRLFIIILSLILLTGCWSNQELDQSALVHGVGLDKSDDQLHFSVEIIKPGGGQASVENDNQGSAQSIVLEDTDETLLDGARHFIRYTKRRLDFGHTAVWVISEEMAKEDFVRPLDVIRRDQMPRLNSHVFITPDESIDILNTPTLYENLVSLELASALDQVKYIATFAPITMREFYKSLEGPVGNAYIPIIYLDEVNEQNITAIGGTAVINKDRMVGKLNDVETAGLNELLNNINGGSISVNLNEDEKVSLDISNSKTKTTPKLIGNQLEVTIESTMEGTLADNMTDNEINEAFFKEMEQAISKKIKQSIRLTLDKLQELKTDITEIGPKTHRKYPKRWEEIRGEWDEIFANAKITINVDTNITHTGLVNESINREKKPHNNPYLFTE